MAKKVDQYPDLVFYNGKIVCVDKRFSVAEAVAVKGERFVAVGGNKDVLDLAGPSTRKISLDGSTVLPGLIDSHNHMTQVGLGLMALPLEGCTCIDDISGSVARVVKTKAPGEWVTTALVGEPAISHLLKEKRYPTRYDLDPVSPDNPVCIVSFHVFIVNSCALRLAGIDKSTAEPQGGRIGVNELTGEPDGILYEEPAMALVRPLLPLPTYKEKVDGLKEACRRYNAVGLTSICEHGLGFEEARAYQELWKTGDLSVRSYLHFMIEPHQSIGDLEEMIQRLAYIASPGFGDKYMKLGGLKLIFDGGVGIGTALMRQPYKTASGKTSNGVQVFSTDAFREIVRLANRYGLRIAQHDSGGKAIDLVLGVYKDIDAERSIRDKRFVMVHCQFPTRENMADIRELGAVVVTQTVFLYTMGLGYLKYLGNETANSAIPMREWIDNGLRIALGSDAPVNSFDPLLGIWHAVSRREKTTGEVIGPGQRITREEAIRCYTINGAYITFDEHQKGSIETGKLADFVVLSNDFLSCPEEAMKETTVRMTVVGGSIVHEAW